MMSRTLAGSTRLLLAIVLALAALTQLLLLPWLSGEMARAYPEIAHLRWPMLTAAVVGLGCFEVVLTSTWVLVGAVRTSRIFDPESLRWVDYIVWALIAALVLSLGTFALLLASSIGPISVPAAGLLVSLAMTGAVLMAITLRSLLHQATALQSEMNGVI